MKTFKVGDRVISINPVGNKFLNNCTGTVIEILSSSISVEFDEDIDGHAGSNSATGKDKHCWFVPPDWLRRIKAEGEENMEEKKTCYHCGEEITDYSYEELYIDGDYRYVCEDCVNEKYTKCYDCGDLMLNEDVAYFDNGTPYCQHCFDSNFVRCYECDNFVHIDGSMLIAGCYGDGHERICEDCYEHRYRTCEDCGAIYHEDDMNWGDWDGPYCNGCWNESHRDGYDGICDYHCGPELEFFDKDGEVRGAGFKGYGFELEVDNGGHDHDTAKMVVDKLNQRVYCASDGSINNGFEIISHPHTREAMEKLPIDDVLRWLVSQGYRSHDSGTCGLHLHASKLLFGDEEKDRIKNIAKIVLFYEIFWDDILKVSRRKPSQISSWANKYGMSKKETYEMVDKAVKNNHRSIGRYYAVNLSNSDTVEFRLMRGTLNVKTFWATLDFLMTTVENSKWIPLAKVDRPELWLRHMKPETLEYIRSRGAFASVVGERQVENNEENNEERGDEE